MNAITYHEPGVELTSEQEEYSELQTDMQSDEIVKNKPKRRVRRLFGKK